MTERPEVLRGLRVLVTRRPEQAGELSRRLRELGASVVEIATVGVAPPLDPTPFHDALRRLERYDWIVLTSANAVEAVAGGLRELELPWPPGVRVATVGPATARAAEALVGRAPDLQPGSEFRAEGLAEAFAPETVERLAFLLPASDKAREVLPAALRARGAVVDVVTAYRTVAPADLAVRVRSALAEGVGLTTFASPSAVENLASAAGELAAGLPAAVIGPVTEAAAREAGLDVLAVANPSTVEGLVDAIVARFRGAPRRPAPRT